VLIYLAQVLIFLAKVLNRSIIMSKRPANVSSHFWTTRHRSTI
jgi:hypothetical protein